MKRDESNGSDLDLRRRLESVYEAHMAAAAGMAPGDMPATREIRDLLRLFAKIGNEDLRHAVLCLLRTIVGFSA